MEPPTQPQQYPQLPLAAQVVQQPTAKPPKRRFSWARLFTVLLAFGLLGSLLLNVLLLAVISLSSLESEPRVQEKFFSHQRDAHDKVAILSIEGTILDGEGFFKRQIDRATKDAKDGNLKALVVRVNSPGGTITGSDYIYHHLRKLAQETNLPIVVSMGGLAASGGYYVSMAVGDRPNTIFAEPTTWTGSIGVIIPHYNLSPLLKNWGIEDDSIASARLKGMGSFTKPMTEEERKIFQELVDDGLARFKSIVQEGRPNFKQDPAALDKLATGQVFTAQQAQQCGLVDQIGFIEAAVDRAIELAGLDKEHVRVVKYKPEPSLADFLLGGTVRSRPALDLAAMLEMAAPRAYYLYTALPPLTSSARP
jgi:protease-4